MEISKVKIQIDGKNYEVEPAKNLLHTCLALGFDIPYFCYHPALGSVGACRQCAVKKFRNADDKKGRIVMSCMEPAVDGLIISTNDSDVKRFRAAIIESLMTNHPHDCPVCDEGGECHLQDMTVMTGHNYRRFNFKKRTHYNQYLGPYLHHEMNRCIQCYRCVRFYRDYAGGSDLHVFGSAANVYFGRHKDGKLENEFSGNLVEVCPTGVFTDKTLQEHYTRKWDLTNSPSICSHCSLGCNIIMSERYGSVRRVLNRYNSDINGYFICDKGRFGYQEINSSERIRKVWLKDTDNTYKEVSHQIFKSKTQEMISDKKIAGIGSPHASLESNFALEMLVGKENFYHGISDVEYSVTREAIKILKSGAVRNASLKDVEKSDALLLLGENLKNASRLALSIRQMVRNKSFRMAQEAGISLWNDAAVRDLAQDTRSPVFLATIGETMIDDIVTWKHSGSEEDISGLGFRIASEIDKAAPSPGSTGRSQDENIRNIATTLKNAQNPVIITCIENMEILHAAANVVNALVSSGKKPSLLIVFPACNSVGLGLMEGNQLMDLYKRAEDGKIDTLVVLENDLFNVDNKQRIDELVLNCRNIIYLGPFVNETSTKASIIMPSGTFAEATGTIVNNEGRAQRFYRVLPDDGKVKDSWKHIADMIQIQDNEKYPPWKNFDAITDLLIDNYPLFSKIKEILPDSNFRYFSEKIARQTPRYSGRTAMYANIDVSEPKPPDDDDSPFKFSMEGFKGKPPADLTPYYWSPGWNSQQAINKYLNEPGGLPADGNPGVILFEDKEDGRLEYFNAEKK